MDDGEIRTAIGYGNMGWVCVRRDGLPGLLYLRFAKHDGRWQVREMYLDCSEGREIRGKDLRELPLAAIEALVLTYRDQLDGRAQVPGPDLATLATNYATTFGRRAMHWVAESMRDIAGNRRLRQQPGEFAPRPPRVPPLDRPDHIDDDFLRRVADAYAGAIRRGAKSPAAAIAAESVLPVRTVHRWIYLARKAGHLPPGSQGRVG